MPDETDNPTNSQPPTTVTRQDLESKVIARAWKDSGFKERLLRAPCDTIKREAGINLPTKVSVEVLEERSGTLFLVMPPRPTNADLLSDEELQALAAGECSNPYGETHS